MGRTCIICGGKANGCEICRKCREIVEVILVSVFKDTGGDDSGYR